MNMTSLKLIIILFVFVMAQQFSVRDWLKAISVSKYEPNFLKHGYSSYDAITNLTVNKLKGAGLPEYLARNVDYLKAVSEDAAIRELSVSVLAVHVGDHCVFVGTIYLKQPDPQPHR